MEDVAPGPHEHVVVLPDPATVTGFFFDDGGRVPPAPEEPEEEGLGLRRVRRAVPGLSIFLNARDGQGVGSADSFEAGRFSFDRVEPGRHRLTIRTDESLIHRSDWFEVPPGGQVDLGTIRSEPAGSLVVDVDAGTAVEAISTVVRGEDLDILSFMRARGTELVAEELSPGAYYLAADSPGHADLLLPIEIRAGEETRVSVELAPGAARTVSWDFPPDAEWNELRATVRDEEGRLVSGKRIERARPGTGSLFHLKLGTFHVEAETDTGLEGRVMIDVPDLTPQSEPIVVELR